MMNNYDECSYCEELKTKLAEVERERAEESDLTSGYSKRAERLAEKLQKTEKERNELAARLQNAHNDINRERLTIHKHRKELNRAQTAEAKSELRAGELETLLTGLRDNMNAIEQKHGLYGTPVTIDMHITELEFRAEQAEKERDEAKKNYQFMVDRAADEHLEGYRELGDKLAQAENERDTASRSWSICGHRADRYLRALTEIAAYDCESPGGDNSTCLDRKQTSKCQTCLARKAIADNLKSDAERKAAQDGMRCCEGCIDDDQCIPETCISWKNEMATLESGMPEHLKFDQREKTPEEIASDYHTGTGIVFGTPGHTISIWHPIDGRWRNLVRVVKTGEIEDDLFYTDGGEEKMIPGKSEGQVKDEDAKPGRPDERTREDNLMIDLNTAADVVDELDEIGLQNAGQTSGIHVAGGLNAVAIEMDYRLWDDQDGSDWTQQNEKDVETPEDLREAVLGELEARAKFLLAIVEKAREPKDGE